MTISSNVSYIHTYEWIVLSESPASYRLGQNHWPIPDRRGRRMSVSSVFLNMTEDVHQCEWGRRHIFIQKYLVFLFSIAFGLKNNMCWYSIRLFLCSSQFKIQSNLNICVSIVNAKVPEFPLRVNYLNAFFQPRMYYFNANSSVFKFDTQIVNTFIKIFVGNQKIRSLQHNFLLLFYHERCREHTSSSTKPFELREQDWWHSSTSHLLFPLSFAFAVSFRCPSS